MIWKKTERTEIGAEALIEAEVAFSTFSAAQANAAGFILVGTVHFNPGRITLDEGRAEFVLRLARICAEGRGCACEYESIAYIARSAESQTAKAQTTETVNARKEREAQAEAHAGAGLGQGLSAGATAQGKLRHAFDEQAVQVLSGEAEGTKSLIVAYPTLRRDGRAGKVEWKIQPDPLIPYEDSGGSYRAVIGERMRAANDGAGLAVVRMTEPGGRLEMRLEVRAADIRWTEVEFAETSPLHHHGKRLVGGKEKRDIVGRLALAKALEGTVTLQRLPREGGDD